MLYHRTPPDCRSGGSRLGYHTPRPCSGPLSAGAQELVCPPHREVSYILAHPLFPSPVDDVYCILWTLEQGNSPLRRTEQAVSGANDRSATQRLTTRTSTIRHTFGAPETDACLLA